MTTVRPATSAEPAEWLLGPRLDWATLVRFGPPGFEVSLRIAFRFDEQDGDEAVVECFQVLAGHTGTPGRCFAAVWEGWGSSRPIPEAPAVSIPQRPMLLFETEVADLPWAPAMAWGEPDRGEPPPHLAWPADRAWCFACDVDEDIEFSVGCSEDAARALEAVLPVQVRRTTYGVAAPLWRDEIWPLRAVIDHPLNRRCP